MIIWFKCDACNLYEERNPEHGGLSSVSSTCPSCGKPSRYSPKMPPENAKTVRFLSKREDSGATLPPTVIISGMSNKRKNMLSMANTQPLESINKEVDPLAQTVQSIDSGSIQNILSGPFSSSEDASDSSAHAVTELFFQKDRSSREEDKASAPTVLILRDQEASKKKDGKLQEMLSTVSPMITRDGSRNPQKQQVEKLSSSDLRILDSNSRNAAKSSIVFPDPKSKSGTKSSTKWLIIMLVFFTVMTLFAILSLFLN